MSLDIHFSGEPGDASFDLVAVHGFFNTSSETWDLGSETEPWLKEQLTAKKRYGRLLFHRYDTGASAVKGLCGRGAIQKEAIMLLQKVAEQRKDQDPPRPLIFLALDFGGLIIKEAIIQASRHTLEFANISASTRLMSFVGTPHRWHNKQDLESKLASFLFAKRPTALTVEDINRLAKTVSSISEEFLQTRATIHSTLISVCSEAPDAYGIHQIFTSSFGIPMELRFSAQSVDAVQEVSVRDALIETLESRILGVINAPTPTNTLAWLNGAVVVQAPSPTPIMSVKTADSDHVPFSWLDDSPVFKEWMNHEGCKIMHIHGSSNVSVAASYAYQQARIHASTGGFTSGLTLYFRFDRHDCQRNTIKSMANLFLAQTIARFGTLPASAQFPSFEPPLFDKALTEKDVFFLLNSFRLDCNRPARTTWVLDRLDECEPASCNWFLNQLASIAARCELYFKVLITTASPKHVQTQLAAAGCESLSLDIASSQVGPGIKIPPVPASHHCPALEPYAPQLSDLLGACQPDQDLFRMVVDWLNLKASRWNTRAEMAEVVTALSPPSPRVLLGAVMQAVPTFLRPVARDILCWVRNAVRPLTPLELASALEFQGADLGCLNIELYIAKIFGPLLTTRHGEVHFTQPWVRELLSTLEKTTQWYAAASTADDHKEIAKACLRFLRLPETIKALSQRCGGARASGVLLTSRHDIVSYAVTFWPTHYRLGYLAADSSASAPEDLTSFLGDSKALRAWFSAHGYLLPPHQQPHSSYLSALPIVSHLGLETQVENMLPIHADLPTSLQELEDALCEASRMGHKNIVDLLLSRPWTLTLHGVVGAMEAAALAAEYELVEVLFAYAKNKHKDQATSHMYPHSILARLAWAGKGRLLESLMQGRPSGDPTSPTAPASKLLCAVATGQLGTIKTLLQHGEDANYQDETRLSRTPLHMACRSGYGDAVRALVADGAADIDGHNGQGQTALQKAINLGNIDATKALLDGGADIASVEAEIPRTDGSFPYPAFYMAACESSFQCITAVLERGANADATTDEYTPLCYAAVTGKLAWAKLLLAHGARVNGLGKWVPLCQATAKNTGKNMDMVKLLLEHGADINASGSADVATPLERASEANLLEVVEFLMAKGADIGLHGAGSTALSRAASKGHTKMVRYLLKAGSNPNEAHPAATSWKALHWAHHHPECLEVLLDSGADIDAMSKDGTAVYIASYNNHLESVKLLISRGANLELTCEFPDLWDSNCTALLGAAGKGNAEIVRALLDAGADITARSPRDETALHLAISHANSEATVRVLLEYTPDLNAQESFFQHTALHRLMLEATTHLSIAKILVTRGTSLEIRNKGGYTVLDYAIYWREYEVAKYLVRAKAKINTVGSTWGGPLHIACWRMNLDMIRFLVANGADANMIDNSRGVPLLIAMTEHQEGEDVTLEMKTAVVRYLIEEAKADVTVRGGMYFITVLNGACMQPDADLLQYILDQDTVDSDINTAGFNGCRPIHFATYQSLEHVSKVLARGADINACDKLGRTTLHTAVASGRPDVVEKILSLTGSRYINETDRDGWTPLMWAVRQCSHWGVKSDNQEEIVRLLLDHGASLWTTGRTCHEEGWSALKLARYYGASQEVILLLTPKQRHYLDDKGEPQVWDPQAHRSRRAKRQNGFCDLCLYTLWGSGYANGRLWLCAKCYTYQNEFFPELKDWKPANDGEEFDPDAPEEQEEEAEPAVGEIGEPSPGQVKQVQTTEADYWSDSDSD
ncbi:hypothetical protein QC763_401040 [Podospora pseudopauciseta]|uniref:Nephrocystin 3-like N-terminal domain-containing protein n=1 Tax=Podospora pseudopauciseta TaxID=2093780 RepID=A0ABR0HBR8_9PEZI|nr:hypothetical protein QC763_401040 [Podospora pseudopauciseta]